MQEFTHADPMPRISIAMATYNGERFIREQLESIARQSLLPIELVVTDDGSTDRTMEIVEAFSLSAPFPVRAVRNETRLGYKDNFLKAASLCAGGIIAFCDQDDIWLENKLSLCSKYFSDNSVGLVLHAAHTFTQEGIRGHKWPDLPRNTILDVCDRDPFRCPPGFAMLFRKDLLHLTDNTNRPWCVKAHDQWCWFLATCSSRIALVADSLALYRQHPENTCGAPEPNEFLGTLNRNATDEDYISLAESELACSHILTAAAEQHPAHAKQMKQSARKIARRSRLHLIRSRIYAPQSSLPVRAATVGRIAWLGGYFPDPARMNLGVRAALKDVFLGVMRPHRRKISATG